MEAQGMEELLLQLIKVAESIKPMSRYEIIGILLSVVAAIVSILTLFVYIRGNKTSSATLESQIRAEYSKLNFEFSELQINIAKLKQEKEALRKAYINRLNMVQEEKRNTIEDLCQKYLSGRVDRKWVETMFRPIIIKYVENQKNKGHYSNSPYTETLKVFNKFKK